MLENPIELQVEPAKIQFDGYYVRDLQFSVRENPEEMSSLVLGTGLNIHPAQAMEVLPPSVKVEVDFSKNAEDPLNYRIVLRLESTEDSEEKSCPYSFVLETVGFFSMTDSEPSEDTDFLATYNGVMLLYSTAREILASVTNRGPFPALLLPTAKFSAKSEANSPKASKPRKRSSKSKK
jgi:preprotein translocase subunit SecB